MVVYIVSLPCANFYVHSCCICGVQLICSCVFGYFQVHQVSLLKKIITSVFQKLFSSNNFFLALKSIYFHPRTSLYPPPLGFCIGVIAKLIFEKWRRGVIKMYVRAKLPLDMLLCGYAYVCMCKSLPAHLLLLGIFFYFGSFYSFPALCKFVCP